MEPLADVLASRAQPLHRPRTSGRCNGAQPHLRSWTAPPIRLGGSVSWWGRWSVTSSVVLISRVGRGAGGRWPAHSARAPWQNERQRPAPRALPALPVSHDPQVTDLSCPDDWAGMLKNLVPAVRRAPRACSIASAVQRAQRLHTYAPRASTYTSTSPACNAACDDMLRDHEWCCARMHTQVRTLSDWHWSN